MEHHLRILQKNFSDGKMNRQEFRTHIELEFSRLEDAGTAEDLVSSMKEKVWQCNVSRSMIDKYMNEYLVGNIKTTKTGAELRIISIEKPTEDAVAVEKNLEDAFLFYFGEKSEEKQDA